MKQGWEIKKLGEVCEVLNGLWIGKKEPFVNICVIRNTNFTKDCKLNMENAAYIDAEVKQFATRKLKIGDIIVEKSGGSEKQPVGRVVLFNIESGDYSFSNFTSALRIKDNIELDCTFLHKCLYAHYLRGETFKLQSKTTGLHNLDMKGYLRLPIPVPPLPEQEKIVSELDCLSGVIEKKRQQLKELDALAQSIFYEMFGNPVDNERGWEVVQLSSAVDEKCPISYGIVQPMDDIQDGVPIVRPVDLIETFVYNRGLKKTSREISDSYKRTILRGDEILMCVRGTTGIVSLATEELRGCNTTRGIVPLFFTKMNRWFMFHLFKSDAMVNLIAEHTYGIALKQINLKDLRQLPIVIPPLPLQQSFAQKIESIEKQKELIKQSIAEVETLFNSRMDFYFN